MKFNFSRLLTVVSLLIAIPSCGFMKEYFPDKEKDYQLTKEIPELVVPSDLSGNKTYSTDNSFSKNDPGLAHQDAMPLKFEGEDKATVDLIEYSDKASRLRITDSLIRSWRVVGKALSHHSIEITNREVLKGTYFIQYDSEFEKVEDGSLWDEVLFIFGSNPAKEQEYLVKLEELTDATEVMILDKSGQELSDGSGLTLLKLLHETIKNDLVEE